MTSSKELQPPTVVEQALRESEQRYRQVLGLMPAAVYTCEAPSGVISFYNEHAARLWGRAPAPGDTDERFCGSFRLWRPDGTPLPHDQTPMALAMSEGREFRNREVVIERPDGTRITALVNIDPLRDAQGRVTGAINVFHDVSDRRRAEEALRESEDRYRAMVEGQSEMVCRFRADGTILFVNGAYARARNMTADDMRGRTFWEFVPEADHASVRAMLGRLTPGAPEIRIENRFNAADGVRWILWTNRALAFDAQGRMLEAQSLGMDITDRKRVEAQLQARARQQQEAANLGELALRERDLQALFERATAAVAATLQVEYCKVLELMPGGNELLLRAGVGWKDGLVGTARVDSGPDSQAGYTLATDAPVIVKDLRDERRFRGPKLLLNHGVVSGMSCVIRLADGTPWGVLGVHTTRLVEFTQDDISFLTTVASILSHAIHRERTEAALREADRRKDEFLATLSHELRNPLAPLRNALNLLRLSGARAGDIVPIHEMMERQVGHLVRLVDDLLEISRINHGTLELRRERVEVASVVRNALETSDPLVKAGEHQVSVSLPDGPLWLDGDPVRLAQILANILNNAAQYTARGGRIAVAARQEGSTVAIAVRDNGPGISPEALPHVFRMFGRGRGPDGAGDGGLGIGLSIAQHLAVMHDGKITARSEGPGKGSEFTVTLPLATGSRLADPVGTAITGTISRKRILVVDDNHDAADSLGMLLKHLGADVRVARDGHEALRAYSTYDPAVVLLDIGLPGIDGYEVARRMRAGYPGHRAAIVALTGWGQDADRLRAREAGIDHHLVKPAELHSLRALLESVRP